MADDDLGVSRRTPVEYARETDAPDETATLTLTGTVVAVGVLVSVALDDPAATSPFLFLPDEFRRLGVEPRVGHRWALAIAVDLAGAAIRATRLVGLSAP